MQHLPAFNQKAWGIRLETLPVDQLERSGRQSPDIIPFRIEKNLNVPAMESRLTEMIPTRQQTIQRIPHILRHRRWTTFKK